MRVMPKITDGELLLISKARADKIRSFALGVLLVDRGKSSIERLCIRVAKDRFKLAKSKLRDAVQAASCNPALWRTGVSRAYYAMYHAARSVTYLAHGGDDHEEHSMLPGKLPPDFPDSDQWRNKLKMARLNRNKADYDPYPVGDLEFEATCQELIQDATIFLRLSQRYINQKARNSNDS